MNAQQLLQIWCRYVDFACICFLCEMSGKNIKGKHGEEIHVGDVVGTRYRAGTRDGAGSSKCTVRL